MKGSQSIGAMECSSQKEGKREITETKYPIVKDTSTSTEIICKYQIRLYARW